MRIIVIIVKRMNEACVRKARVRPGLGTRLPYA